jgi:imidazolonepropionase-like amidohydrolase
MTTESPQRLVIVNARFVDGLASHAAGDDAILCRAGDIVALGAADDMVALGRTDGPVDVLDVEGAHVLPGLIDMHTHLSVVHPDTTDEARLADESAAALALRMAMCANDAVRSGVTTVRLVSEGRGADFALRAAIERGDVVGPRIFTAGRALTGTGGHGLGSHAVEVDGPASFRAQARRTIAEGADLVKVMISGGISDQDEGMDRMQVTIDELSAAVDVAHAWGRPVAGHLGGADVIAAALDCGIDSVEHGYVLDDAVAARMAADGVWLVPTSLVTRGREYFERIRAPGWLVDRLESVAARHRESVAIAARHEVRILAGTDFLPAERFDETSAMVRECELLVEAGLAPLDALGAATTRAAACLGVGDRLGFVAPDMCADLVAVDGDPSCDISALRRLRVVVARGRIVNSRPGQRPHEAADCQVTGGRRG